MSLRCRPACRDLAAIAIGQRVTRLPRHRSRRAVFPHLALQKYSLPRPASSSQGLGRSAAGPFVLASGALKPSPSASSPYRGCIKLRRARTPLRCTYFPVYASTGLFGFRLLSSSCNTRYEWLVRPYSAGTLTLQESAPSPPGALTLASAELDDTMTIQRNPAAPIGLQCLSQAPMHFGGVK